MKMKLFLGLFSALLISMVISLNTASAKAVLSNEMDTNPFNKGSVSNGVWKDSADSGASSDATWASAWKYDNTKDYDITAKYTISGSYAAQLNLGLVRIAYIRDDESWLQKGVFIKDGTTWKKVSSETSATHVWKVSYKADKTFAVYKDDQLVTTGTVNTLPTSQTMNITNYVNFMTTTIDYVRINDNTPSTPAAPANLSVVDKNNTALLTWDTSSIATSYTVSRSVYANGPFEDIAKDIKDVTFTDTSVKAGNTYYYTVKAANESGASPASNTANVTFETPRSSLDVIIAPDSIKVGETFTADIALKNVQDIYAEDFSLSYDPTLVEYAGYEAVTGYKVYNETKDTPGALRFIVASQGKSYAINNDTVIVKLKFKAIAAGSAKIDALKARIADTTKEYDLETANVLEDTILIEKPRFLDVDRSGQYTLLDLSLDAFYFGMSAADTNKDLHDADQTEDDQVGDDDLVYIVNQIMQNKEYTPNK